jgi:hypothetical protein
MRERRALRDEAIEWLRQELKEGPLAQKQIRREAREHGFSYPTLRRAKEELKLQSKRIGFGPLISYWAWVLPEGVEKVEGAEAVEEMPTPAPVADVSTNAKTAEKTAAQPKPGKSKGKDSPWSAELDDYLAGLGPDLDHAALTRMMTPAMVTRIIRGSRDLSEGSGGQPARRSRKKRRNGKHGRHTTNGHHESNGKAKG